MLRTTAHRLRIALVLALGSLSIAAAPPATTTPPKRIVSLNMCTDQLVIALADRAQIAGLTEWARDPSLSYYAREAQTLPFTHRSAEEVIALRPDLVIGAPFRTKQILAPLKARGVRMIPVPQQDSYQALVAAVRTIAAATGHADRGELLIAQMQREIAAVGAPPGRGRIAAYYQRQGYLTGTGTLVDDLMRQAGLGNLARRFGGAQLPKLGLEQMALARPDFLIMDTNARSRQDRGSAILRHPLLDSAVPPSHHLTIPQAMTVCGTPGYPKALALLARQIRAADAQAVR